MKSPQDVIRAPLISEKGTQLTESANQVLFKVSSGANKIEVKRAVESLFKVTVVQVRHWQKYGAALRLEKGLRDAQRGRQDRLFWRRIETGSENQDGN